MADRSGSVAGVPGGQAAVLDMQIHPNSKANIKQCFLGGAVIFN